VHQPNFIRVACSVMTSCGSCCCYPCTPVYSTLGHFPRQTPMLCCERMRI
jgi:hypothetical protein